MFAEHFQGYYGKKALRWISALEKAAKQASTPKPTTPSPSPPAAKTQHQFPRSSAVPGMVRVMVGVGQEARETWLKPVESFRDLNLAPEMVVIPAGSFTMGSLANEEGRYNREGPKRKVTIAKPFAVGRYAVTFDEWDAYAADGGSGILGIWKTVCAFRSRLGPRAAPGYQRKLERCECLFGLAEDEDGQGISPS